MPMTHTRLVLLRGSQDSPLGEREEVDDFHVEDEAWAREVLAKKLARFPDSFVLVRKTLEVI